MQFDGNSKCRDHLRFRITTTRDCNSQIPTRGFCNSCGVYSNSIIAGAAMKASSAVLLQPNKSRPGMRRDLPTKLYYGASGSGCGWPRPDASAQSRYADNLVHLLSLICGSHIYSLIKSLTDVNYSWKLVLLFS